MALNEEWWEDLYGMLKRIANHRLIGHISSTISPTVLVHEVFLKLKDKQDVQDKNHFLALASRAMRFYLIDRVRANKAQKAGFAVTLHDAIPEEKSPLDPEALVDCFEKLEQLDPRLVKVMECRLFGGLSLQETADVCEISLRTTERLWQKGKLYLKKWLSA